MVGMAPNVLSVFAAISEFFTFFINLGITVLYPCIKLMFLVLYIGVLIKLVPLSPLYADVIPFSKGFLRKLVPPKPIASPTGCSSSNPIALFTCAPIPLPVIPSEVASAAVYNAVSFIRFPQKDGLISVAPVSGPVAIAVGITTGANAGIASHQLNG